MATSRPSAADVTVAQTVALLDSDFDDLIASVADGGYTIWLGSGISLGRVASLKGVVGKVLSFLQERSVADDPHQDFRRALDEAMELAELTQAQLGAINYEVPVESWPDLQLILGRLVNKYSLLLDVRVPHHPRDLLLWEGVDVAMTFAAENLEPDTEHLALAVLMIEGVLPNLVSANWDPLVEAAMRRLTGGTANVLRVCVLPTDLQKPALQARLYKFHGCAALATQDPATYREYLVGAQSQITEWPHNPAFAAMRHQILGLALSTPTLMIGLSAQDTDIQDLFVSAKTIMRWTWPTDPPAYAFAEQRLGTMQRNLLKAVYSRDYETCAAEIEKGALIPAYSKQLLTAIVMNVLSLKMKALLERVVSLSSTALDLDMLASGISTLRDRAAAAAERGGVEFMSSFLSAWARAICLFRRGRLPFDNQIYEGLTTSARWKIASDAHLEVSGEGHAALATALLGLGEQRALWRVGLAEPSDTSSTALELEASERSHRVLFVATASVEVSLYEQGVIELENPNLLILHSDLPARRMTRSPSSAPGRTGRSSTRSVDLRSILNEASDLDELLLLFREGCAL